MSTTTLTYSTAGSYNWYCLIGVTSITVNLWGGGAGGGRSTQGTGGGGTGLTAAGAGNNGTVAGGGGGGAYDSITTARIGGVGGIGGMEITYVSSTFNLIIWML